MISKNINSNIIECIGPETLTFKEILERLKLIDKKRLLNSFSFHSCKNFSKDFSIAAKSILTEDQLRLLKYDNILSGKYKNNLDIGCPSKNI